ncbi:MAG: polysaccharide deacetylase family protein [Clostridia bacterium]|nr:polysaccharide deacetylase family protein [Clostridia bacterium]
MKNKFWIGLASTFLSLSVVILIALVFFGDYIDSIDEYFNAVTASETVAFTDADVEPEIETAVTTTTVTTTQPITETTTRPKSKPSYYGSDDKLVAFTFDDGPSPAVTPQILDILERCGGKATFFVLGNMAVGKENIFQRMLSLGCQIGNHSFAHARYKNMGEEEIRADFEKSQAEIKRVCGIEPELFRVPYGDNNSVISSAIDAPIVFWSIDTLDWSKKDKSGVNRSEEERNAAIRSIYDGVINHVEPGDIVLMHDLYQITVDAFDEIATALTEDGWKLVTVEEMFVSRGYELTPGVAHRCAK